LEYADNGELFDNIKRKTKLFEDEAREYFNQITNVVAYCHSKNVAHRDLKPENIFLTTKNTIKIGDFGFSIIFSQEKK